MDWNTLSAIATALAVIVSLIALYLTYVSQKRMEALAARQDRLAHQSWADSYFREITEWSCEVCKAIAEAIHLVGSKDQEARLKVLVSLSAGIDMGRWYLPNRIIGDHGANKEPAYRGYRHAALDWIVRAYDICREQDKFNHPSRDLIECQRYFVSAIQEVLDPRSRETSIHRVLESFKPVAGHPQIESPPKVSS